jgi:osmotically-inducible protein OsmY
LQNELLTGDVRDELDCDPQLDAANVGVNVMDGAVTGSGFVSSSSEKWAAVRAAERVYGVQAIADVDLGDRRRRHSPP